MELLGLEMTRTRTAIWRVAITQYDVPLDLSGMTLRFAAKVLPSDTAAVIEKATASGITAIDEAGGIVELEVSPSDTEALANVRTVLVCDMVLVDGSREYQVASGKITILPNVAS